MESFYVVFQQFEGTSDNYTFFLLPESLKTIRDIANAEHFEKGIHTLLVNDSHTSSIADHEMYANEISMPFTCLGIVKLIMV